MSIHDDIVKGQIDQIARVAINTGRKDIIEKAMIHKYIRKEPDGKGGWNYIYNEEDKHKLSEEDKYFIDDLKEAKLNLDKSQVKYKFLHSWFELRKVLEDIKWPKLDWEDFAVSRGNIKEEDKREGKTVFSKYDISSLFEINDVERLKSRIKRINSIFSDYKEEFKPIKDQVSEIKKTLKDYLKYTQEYEEMKKEHGYF